MKTNAKLLTLGLAGVLLPTALLLSTPVRAQSVIYCCDANGQKQCGDFLPKDCQKRAYEERDGKGYLITKHDAPLTAEQQAKRDAEQVRKAELAQKQLEEKRRNQALLSTYASEQDIDKARDRALGDVDRAITQAEKALADATKSQKALDKEQEFYKGKPLPAQLKKQIEAAAQDVQAKTDAVNKRKLDKERVAAEFENEKVRFRQLSGAGGKTGVKLDDKPKREVIIQAPAGAEAAGTPTPATPAAPAEKPAEAPPAKKD